MSRNELAGTVSLDARGVGSLIFVNRFFYPDHSATSQLLSDLAFDLSERRAGNVVVITSRQRYDDAQASLASHETIRGVKVFRVWTTRFGRGGLIGRAVDYMSFYISSFFATWRLARSGDILIAKTDPPLISLFVAIVVRLRGATLVNWVQDLFPEVARELGVKALDGMVFRIVKKLRDSSVRAARCNVVLGRLMKIRLENEGVESSCIKVIPNWVDDDVRPVNHVDNPLRKEWGLGDKFVVGYSGNLGRAHEVDTILAVLDILRNDEGIVFMFIGGGAGLDRLRQVATDKGYGNVYFKEYQPRQYLAESLSVADVHLVSLLPRLEGLIVPSKFYGILAVGRPVIYIGSPNGEIPSIIDRESCGFTVDVGEASILAQRLRACAENRREVNAMGKNSRMLYQKCYQKQIALDEWREVLGVRSAYR